MPSKFRQRQKRLRKRDRARARASAQPGVQVLSSLEKRFDELLTRESPRDILAGALASQT